MKTTGSLFQEYAGGHIKDERGEWIKCKIKNLNCYVMVTACLVLPGWPHDQNCSQMNMIKTIGLANGLLWTDRQTQYQCVFL